MLIKRIELENFRVFKGKHEIKFTTDEKKNVTVIMGDNGAGKTTLAQAFLWCLYGENDFKNKEMLNLVTKSELEPQELAKVRVAVDVMHEGIAYYIARAQKYQKDYNGKVVSAAPTLEVFKIEDGKRTPYNSLDSELVVKKMLPQELSQFFFFDGERIRGLSEELEKGKSKGFANAVRQLVGLTAMMNAIEHLKPSKTASLVGIYNKKIDDCGSKKIKELGTKVEEKERSLEHVLERLEAIDSQKVFYDKQISDTKHSIAKFASAESFQRQHEELKKDEVNARKNKDLESREFLKYFSKIGPKYLGKHLVLDALSFLKDLGGIDKGIPDITGRSIEFLIKRKTCVCGTDLVEGGKAYEEICKAAEYLPPKSLGVMINDFVTESKHWDEFTKGFFEDFTGKFKAVRNTENKIASIQAKIIDIDMQLKNIDEVAGLKKSLIELEKSLERIEEEEKDLLVEKGSLGNEIATYKKEREGLISVDKNNQAINQYRMYAIAAHDELKRVYDQKESETREKLEKAINQVFTDIYSDALFIEIDSKYNVKVSLAGVRLEETSVEHSTAQSYSIIFAYIAGIIKLIKENAAQNNNSESELCYTEKEGYPLVMDAPLSAFDKKRIKNICNTLPQIARQIIVFIKDTDGDIAEKNMDMVIGNKYMINIDQSCTSATITGR